ncbi:hypothetical protein ABPG72_021649 [Tetrahymena utriculariae]
MDFSIKNRSTNHQNQQYAIPKYYLTKQFKQAIRLCSYELKYKNCQKPNTNFSYYGALCTFLYANMNAQIGTTQNTAPSIQFTSNRILDHNIGINDGTGGALRLYKFTGSYLSLITSLGIAFFSQVQHIQIQNVLLVGLEQIMQFLTLLQIDSKQKIRIIIQRIISPEKTNYQATKYNSKCKNRHLFIGKSQIKHNKRNKIVAVTRKSRIKRKIYIANRILSMSWAQG